MAREGTQKKLERVRPPRVNISYDVETGGAVETKELPFLMGVLADLSGNPAEALPASQGPQVRRGHARQLRRGAEEHEAARAVHRREQAAAGAERARLASTSPSRAWTTSRPRRSPGSVGPLKELLDLRTKLADLRGSLQGNDKLEEILQNTLNDAGRDEEARVGDRTPGRQQWLRHKPSSSSRPRTRRSAGAQPARPDRRRRAAGPRRGREGARQGPGQALRQRGAEGHGDDRRRHGGDDQRAHRADRRT